MICCYVSIHAQPISFQHITTNEGLSQNSVISVAQDSSGFLYFATQDGLNKYDGTNFTVFEEYFMDVTRPTFSQLGKVFVDSHNQIWITTLDGQLKVFDKARQEFSRIEGIREASCISQASDSIYYAGSFSDGLFRITIQKDTFGVKQLLDDRNINQIAIQEEGIFLATSKGVIEFNESQSSQLFPELASVPISKILLDRLGMHVATYGEGVFISENFKSARHLAGLPVDLNVQDIYKDSKDRIWIATYDDGLFLQQNEEITQFVFESQNNLSINYKDILCIFEDQVQNIWFGTDGGGVSILHDDIKPIYRITNNQLPQNFPVDVPRAISTDSKGDIWIGTSGKGLTVTNRQLNKTKHFSPEETAEFYIPENRIMSLQHDPDDNVWIGSQGSGLYYLNEESARIEHIEFLPAKTIWDIELQGDVVWLATRANGLIRYDIKSRTWKLFNIDSSPISSNNIRVILKGKSKHELYLGSEDGEVIRFNTKTELFSTLELQTYSTGSIKSLAMIGNELWIGTQQAGIICYDLYSDDVYTINKNTGLPNHVVYSILPAKDSSVWVSTNLGIVQLDRRKIKQRANNVVKQHYTKDNGLGCNEFNTGAYFVDDLGHFYFGGIDGIYYFDPNVISKEKTPAHILFLDLLTTHKDGTQIQNISDQSTVSLNYKDKNFQIKYTTQDYSPSNTTKYKYKLEGIHDEWISNETYELISFSNIPPGEYSFLLKATNKDGVWNNAPARLHITIVPAFWQTLLFKLAVILCSIFGIWYLFNLRLEQVRRNSSLKERTLRAEAKALKSQMNPHFIFNSLNSIDNYIINNQPQLASDYLTKFAKLMRSILEVSDQEKIRLSEELKNMELYLKMEQLRFKNKFDYTIAVNKELNPHKIFIPTMVIQPFVENSIWHGLVQKETQGHIMISIEKHDAQIEITIEDDGIGRAQADELKSKTATKRKSYGMKITKDRIKLMQELEGKTANIQITDLFDSQNIASGTRVSIRMYAQYSQPNQNLILN